MFGTVTKITEYNTGLSFLTTVGLTIVFIAIFAIMLIPIESKI